MGHHVGIDLGTTNSLIAFTEQDALQCMKLEGDAFPMAVFASCVGLGPDGRLIYGTEARRMPQNVSAFKRHIGLDTVRRAQDQTPAGRHGPQALTHLVFHVLRRAKRERVLRVHSAPER